MIQLIKKDIGNYSEFIKDKGKESGKMSSDVKEMAKKLFQMMIKLKKLIQLTDFAVNQV